MYIMHIDKSRTNEFSSLSRSLCSAALDHRKRPRDYTTSRFFSWSKTLPGVIQSWAGVVERRV